jgi:hypothetical protein
MIETRCGSSTRDYRGRFPRRPDFSPSLVARDTRGCTRVQAMTQARPLREHAHSPTRVCLGSGEGLSSVAVPSSKRSTVSLHPPKFSDDRGRRDELASGAADHTSVSHSRICPLKAGDDRDCANGGGMTCSVCMLPVHLYAMTVDAPVQVTFVLVACVPVHPHSPFPRSLILQRGPS